MMSDQQFVKSFSWMIIWLVVLTVVLIGLGVVIGSDIDEKRRAQSQGQFTQSIVANRTKPVGELNVGEVPTASQQPANTQEGIEVADATGGVGKTVYDTACFICHATGVTGAPKPGDLADWTPRIEQGVETLYMHAINGYQGQKGVMPPKGGNLLISDDEVRAAVDYLVSLVQ